jgi:prevent-host-death family protein
MDRMKISDARVHFADVIGRARYAQQVTTLTDRGKDAAVVISPEQYDEYQRLREEEMRRTVRQRLAEIDAGAPVRVFGSAEEMIAASDADRAARDLRKSRGDRRQPGAA